MTDDAALLASGHRSRLRQRFLTAPEALADYEVLEILLFAAHPRGDVKPLAKNLLKTFGSLRGVLDATPARLKEVEGMGDSGIAALKATREAGLRALKAEVAEQPVIRSWTSLIDYCRMRLGGNTVEELHVLFLNHKHRLIADETQQRGTVDQTNLYPREVVKRALELGASHLILVHNHPSGDVTPSKADIQITQQVEKAAKSLGLSVIDHVIVSRDTHYSFHAHGLMGIS